jgi:predicted RNA-binding protein with PUA-like domain
MIVTVSHHAATVTASGWGFAPLIGTPYWICCMMPQVAREMGEWPLMEDCVCYRDWRRSVAFFVKEEAMAHWLLKTEPDVYSYADLVRDTQTIWDNVANNQALIFIRSMAVGDTCIIYHTGDERRCAGIATVISPPYVNPTDTTGKLAVVDVQATIALQNGYDLAHIKAQPLFADSYLVKLGRLSVVPLTEAQFAYLATADENRG